MELLQTKNSKTEPIHGSIGALSYTDQ